ncbi:MAG: hypothetical protein KJ600_06340 [Nanoarchaeota archaeon]|nr:hypothetical protein [Nanoarchaeota archaeon]MBU1104144.1 hypothetical protein [Nanoarchaeota archaeon]MBU1988878.1 hypothetical protein [Nanoarchaeota archaeon]
MDDAQGFVRIGDLRREHVWKDGVFVAGEKDEWDNISVEPYRAGELAYFSPAADAFYQDRIAEWTVPCGLGGIVGQSFRPLISDLTNDGTSYYYNFDQSKRLVVVCGRVPCGRGVDITKFSLLPLREGEFFAITDEVARGLPNCDWLASFDTLVANRVVDLNDVPIEVIKRVGEIDRSTLRLRPAS